MSVNLTEMHLADLKDRQRDLTNRWMDEESAEPSTRTNRCLEDGCDNRCVKTTCVDCLHAKRQAVNEELGRRNREIRELVQASAGGGEEEQKTPRRTAGDLKSQISKGGVGPGGGKKRTCSQCGGAIQQDNVVGICTSNSVCRAKAAAARYALKHPTGATKRPQDRKPPSSETPAAPRRQMERKGGRDAPCEFADATRANLLSERNRLQERRGEIDRLIGAIDTVLGLAGGGG